MVELDGRVPGHAVAGVERPPGLQAAVSRANPVAAGGVPVVMGRLMLGVALLAGLVAACGPVTVAPTPTPAVAAVPCRVFVTLPADQMVGVARQLVPDDPAFWERVRVAQQVAVGTSREDLLVMVAASLDKTCQLEPDRGTLPELLQELYD